MIKKFPKTRRKLNTKKMNLVLQFDSACGMR